MNDMLVNIITNIIYIVAVLIVVILILALINYTLYTIYSIKEIIVHNTSEDAKHYKLKDIYNYKLINYINTINTNNNYKYDVSSEFNSSSVKIIDMKQFTLTLHTIDAKANPPPSPIDLTYLKYSIKSNKDDNIKIQLENIDILNPEHFMILYDEISIDNNKINKEKIIASYNDGLSTKYYSIEYTLEDYYDYSKNNTVDININKSLYSDIVSISKNAKTSANGTSKKIITKDGIIILYAENGDNSNKRDIYGYILNGLFMLIPTTLLWSNDKYATGLYVKTNNDFYEIILLLVFIIIFIVLIALIYDFYTYIFNIASNGKIKEELFITKIMNKNIYLVVIALCIVIYCIIHSAIYSRRY